MAKSEKRPKPTKPPRPLETVHRFRSSNTGRYVTAGYAKKHPTTTVQETTTRLTTAAKKTAAQKKASSAQTPRADKKRA